MKFAVGVFTNLSPDHLDYHGTLDHYFEAKALLFRHAVIAAAVVNIDDPRGVELFRRLDVPATGFSREQLDEVELRLDGSSFRWRDQQVHLALPGLFNLDNALAAAEASRHLGLADGTIADGLSNVPQVPGRFEVVAGPDGGPTVIVDYSHTPAGIEQVLQSVREIDPGARICIVFGAGGDRDRSKRPLMGAAAAALADRVIVTSDNPRTEDPLTIIEQILAGIEESEATVQVEPDRRAAIAAALEGSDLGDVVVVAGKGHETTQTIGDRVLEFDDRAVVRELVGGATP